MPWAATSPPPVCGPTARQADEATHALQRTYCLWFPSRPQISASEGGARALSSKRGKVTDCLGATLVFAPSHPACPWTRAGASPERMGSCGTRSVRDTSLGGICAAQPSRHALCRQYGPVACRGLVHVCGRASGSRDGLCQAPRHGLCLAGAPRRFASSPCPCWPEARAL